VSRERGPSQAVALWRLLGRNPDYRRVFLASVVSFMGDWFAFVAVSGLVTDLTGADWAPALVFAAEVLPVFLLSPLAGVVADRMDRKRIMISADLARIVPCLGLVLAVVTSQVWLAFLCVVLISGFSAFFQPVTAAVIPNLVEREDLSLAQAALGSVWGTMLFVGAGIGGLSAALLGREASFVLDAATFLASALLVWRITTPLRRGAVAAPASVLAHMGEVWRFARGRKPVRALMTTKAGVGIGNGIVGLLPVYAHDRFGAGDAGIGVLLAARGLGALVGPFVGRALAREDGRREFLVIGLSIVAYAVAYLFLPSAPGLAFAAACVALAHVGGGAQWVMSTHGLQVTTPDVMRGRVMSLDYGLATLAVGTSSLLAAALVGVMGLRGASYALAAIALVYGVSWLVWTRDLWAGPRDPFVAPVDAMAEAAE
jgi:predicted MFS family arabinose efflux permease